MVLASDFDSIGVSLPREWVNMPVELRAFETMCGELRRRWREAPDWNRTDERQAELLLGRVRSELIHHNVRFAAMYADHGSAEDEDDEALMAVVTFATYTREDLGTTLDLTFQNLLAAMAVKPRKTDELRRITNLEPACKHELRLGRVGAAAPAVRAEPDGPRAAGTVLRRVLRAPRRRRRLDVRRAPVRHHQREARPPVQRAVRRHRQHGLPVHAGRRDRGRAPLRWMAGESSPSTARGFVRTFTDMAGRIVVDIAYVDGLKSNVDTTTNGLRGDGGYSARVPSAGRLNDALEDFMGKWDERRGELADSLDAVSTRAGRDQHIVQRHRGRAGQPAGGLIHRWR